MKNQIPRFRSHSGSVQRVKFIRKPNFLTTTYVIKSSVNGYVVVPSELSTPKNSSEIKVTVNAKPVAARANLRGKSRLVATVSCDFSDIEI